MAGTKGLGTRGGNIIGYYKSGRAIYAPRAGTVHSEPNKPLAQGGPKAQGGHVMHTPASFYFPSESTASRVIKGGAVAALGVGVAYAAGKYAHGAFREASNIENQVVTAGKAGATVERLRPLKEAAQSATKHAKNVRLAGELVASAFTSEGINTALKKPYETPREQKTRKVAAAAGGVAAGFALHNVFYKSLGASSKVARSKAFEKAFVGSSVITGLIKKK
jgi:hypothetical protein